MKNDSSSNNLNKETEILEGEIILDTPKQKKREYSNFHTMGFSPHIKINNNCATSCTTFIVSIVLAIIFKNGLLLLLAFLLPSWIFSRRRK